MLPRSIFRAIARTRPLSKPAIPTATLRQPRLLAALRPQLQRHSTPSALQQLTKQRPFSTYNRLSRRYDPYHAANAKPLLTTQQLVDIAKGATFRWVIGVVIVGGSIFYVTHIEEVPVSGRRRFNCFSEEAAEAQGNMAYQEIMTRESQQGRILPEWDPRVKQVTRVLERLITGGNLGTGTAGQQVGWEVHVIDDPETANAFVLPGGKVFVYSGILPICAGDGGLAAVLGHEIAHNLAQHGAERMSSQVLLMPLLYGFVWLSAGIVGPDISYYFGRLVLDLGIMRPSSREQESEADHIGLLLMAESCYDPHAAVGLWQRMEKSQKARAPSEWLSTHPSNEHRIEQITGWIPKAEEKLLESGCSATTRYSRDFQSALSSTFAF